MSQMPDDHQSWLNDARSHAAAGDHLLAYDVATHGLERYPEDAALKHAAVLALARSGATAKARERHLELGLGNVSRGDIPMALYTDIASLGARIARDLALASDPEQRQQLLTQALIGIERSSRRRATIIRASTPRRLRCWRDPRRRQTRLPLRSEPFASGASPRAWRAITTPGRHSPKCT